MPVIHAEKLKWALYKTQELIYERRALELEKKRALNAKLQVPEYNVGDKVKMEVPRVNPGESKKLKFVWSGPWTISRKGRNEKVYYIKDDQGKELLNPVSVARLLPWNSPSDFPILEKDFVGEELQLHNTYNAFQHSSDSEDNEPEIVTDNTETGYHYSGEEDLSEVDSVDVEPRPLPQPPTKPTCKLSSIKVSAADGYT
jgi:hypothetical protein